MNCQEAQSMINAYVNQQMDLKTLELFLDHVDNCSECKEELEVYYMLLISMKQLDEDKNVSADFHAEFLSSLAHAHEQILRYKIKNIRNRFSIMAVIIVAALIMNFSSAYTELREPVPYLKAGTSEFLLPVLYEHFQEKYPLASYAQQYKAVYMKDNDSNLMEDLTMRPFVAPNK